MPRSFRAEQRRAAERTRRPAPADQRTSYPAALPCGLGQRRAQGCAPRVLTNPSRGRSRQLPIRDRLPPVSTAEMKAALYPVSRARSSNLMPLSSRSFRAAIPKGVGMAISWPGGQPGDLGRSIGIKPNRLRTCRLGYLPQRFAAAFLAISALRSASFWLPSLAPTVAKGCRRRIATILCSILDLARRYIDNQFCQSSRVTRSRESFGCHAPDIASAAPTQNQRQERLFQTDPLPAPRSGGAGAVPCARRLLTRLGRSG